MNAGCVCESTNPGTTTWPAQSISITFLRCFLSQESRRASFVEPTETILPPRQSTAASSSMPSSDRVFPRRGPRVSEDWRKVSNWPILTSKSGRGVGDWRLLDELMRGASIAERLPHGSNSCPTPVRNEVRIKTYCWDCVSRFMVIQILDGVRKKERRLSFRDVSFDRDERIVRSHKQKYFFFQCHTCLLIGIFTPFFSANSRASP